MLWLRFMAGACGLCVLLASGGLKPMSQRTKDRLLSLSRELDLIALKWGK